MSKIGFAILLTFFLIEIFIYCRPSLISAIELGDEVVITVDSAKLRKDNSEKGEIICILPKGTTITIINISEGNWYWVKLSEGSYGFIHSSCVEEKVLYDQLKKKVREAKTYSQALDIFRDYLSKYPSSIYRDEIEKQIKIREIKIAKRKAENPVFAEWKDMRARRVPVGTEVRWRLQVYFVYPDIFYAYLEGNHNYRVFGTRMVAPREAFIVAVGDWVEVLGKYAGVGHDGKVQLALYELKNLGPRD